MPAPRPRPGRAGRAIDPLESAHPPDADGHPSDETGGRPSKSARKRESHALQHLGEQLVDLRDDQLLRIPLPEDLLDAIRMARSIRSHEGRRRQLQLVGKLMRQADGEAIRAALEDETREHRTANAIQHAAERWRERLLADDAVLDQWEAAFPGSSGDIAALVMRARSEQASGRAGNAPRALFRALRDRLALRIAPSGASGPASSQSPSAYSNALPD